MEQIITNEATCDNCARVFRATAKRYYCAHCNKYYYICASCAEMEPKCRFCGVPLKRRTEPQFSTTVRRRPMQRA
jgi:hypothetical protein